MWIKLMQTIVALLCSYLFVKWVPIKQPFQFTAFFLEFVLNPFEFLAAGLSFVIGFLCAGPIVSEALQPKDQRTSRYSRIWVIFFIIGLIFIAPAGILQTAVFFSFSLMYGMILLRY